MRIEGVPNAPCGVERKFSVKPAFQAICVPNAPCGVEREFGLS